MTKRPFLDLVTACIDLTVPRINVEIKLQFLNYIDGFALQDSSGRYESKCGRIKCHFEMAANRSERFRT